MKILLLLLLLVASIGWSLGHTRKVTPAEARKELFKSKVTQQEKKVWPSLKLLEKATTVKRTK